MTDDPAQRDPAASPGAAHAGELERAILGDAPRFSADQVDEETAIDLRQFWRALGFPDPGEVAAFTEADRDAVEVVARLVEAGTIDRTTALRITRAVGTTMAKLADWQVATLTEYVEGIEQAGRGTGSRLMTGLEVMRDVEPGVEALMRYAWRRHLAAAVSRVEALGAQDSDLHTVTVTVGFADLVSFTQLSNGLADDHLAALVEDFESSCADLVTGGGGRVIKTLGDSVLYVAPGPQRGVDIACDIVEQIGADNSRPDVHLGLATGPVVMRLGDTFGPPVNLASRLTAVARRNRVIVDSRTADALREVGGYAFRPLTERAVRGFGTIQPIAVRRLRPDS